MNFRPLGFLVSRVMVAAGTAAIYLAGIGAIAAAGVTVVDKLLVSAAQELEAKAPAAPAPDQARPKVTAEQRVLAGKGPPSNVQTVQYYNNRPAPPPKPPQSLGIFGLLFQEPAPPPPPETFATVCVRLCDGYYFPMSFGTTPDNFARDERKCQSSCGSQARLFVYRNPGGSPDSMHDVRGQPYSRLPTAFAYRTSYNESCKCRPHPWEEASLDQHKVYALQDSVRKGDKKAVAELAVLQTKLGEKAVQTNQTSTRVAQTGQPPAGEPEKKQPPPGMMSLGASKPSAANTNPAWRNSAFANDR